MRGITNGLNAVGLKATGYASLLCPVDTGLLRNSITYALGGEGTAKKNYSSEEKHASTETTRKHGTAGKTFEAINGKPYEGTAKEVPGKKTVVIGTNVEYAPYVEMGTTHHQTPQPFLRPAVVNHKSEYNDIVNRFIKEELK